MTYYSSTNGRRTLTADRVDYDPTGTTLTSTTAQEAITELASSVGGGGDLLTYVFQRHAYVSPTVTKWVTDTGILTAQLGEALTG